MKFMENNHIQGFLDRKSLVEQANHELKMYYDPVYNFIIRKCEKDKEFHAYILIKGFESWNKINKN